MKNKIILEKSKRKKRQLMIRNTKKIELIEIVKILDLVNFDNKYI